LNRRGEQFGERRLQEVLRPAAGRPAREILERVLAEVQSFTGGAPAQDDITLVALARKG
jgi:serine phosphatase RsbU (regulator of sigma subunit)